MKSFWGLIPKYLVKNKKRNLFVAISIVLAITLITSLGIIIQTFKQSKLKQLIYDNGGDYDLTISYASSNKKQVESIYKQDCIDNRTKFLEIGNAKVYNSEYFVNIAGYDNQAKDLFKFKLLKGDFPKKDNEIALEGWVLEQFKSTPKIGDKINLPCELKRGKNDIGIDNEFTLVGIFDYKFNNNCNKNIAKGYITMNSAEKKISNNFKVYQENIKLKKDMSIQNAYKNFTCITEENKVDVKKIPIKSLF